MTEESFIQALSNIDNKIKASTTLIENECKKIKDEYDKELLIKKEILTTNKYVVYEKSTMLDEKTKQPKKPEISSVNFLGFLYKINLTSNKTKFLSDKKDSIKITAQILDYSNKEVKIKEKILLKYNDVIYERETDENGKYEFEIKTLLPGRIIISTVNSNMLNSNIIIDAE